MHTSFTKLSKLFAINQIYIPNAQGFGTPAGKTPSLISAHACAQGILWDGVDIGSSVVQLAPGGKIIPGYNWQATVDNQSYPMPSVSAPIETTPYGQAMQWIGYTGSGSTQQQASNGYGILGWLATDRSGNPDPTDPIRVASILQGASVGTGFTVACTYREEGVSGSGNIGPPWIFGKFMNAGESNNNQIVPIANWAFVQTGVMNVDFGYGTGSGTTTVGFVWNENGAPAMIDWTSNIPPLNSLVSLVATAQVVSGGTTTVSFWGSINQGVPVLIGQSTGQVINNSGNGNNEDQIGWAGIVHFTTGEMTSVNYGNLFRGNFNNTVWSNATIAAYCNNPDCYHTWS